MAEGSHSPLFHGIPVLTESEFSFRKYDYGDVFVQISRGDHVVAGHVNVILQHGPHHILRLDQADLKNVDAVICVSKFSRNQQIGYGIPRKILHVLPNGIDTSIFKFRSKDRQPATFIFAGHIRGYKGVSILIRAFMEVHYHHAESSLHLYGENMAWTDADEGMSWLRERNYLDPAGLIDWSRISSDCPGIHYGGEVNQEELSSRFNRSAFVICPSVIPETFGLVSLEAQACGCIPIYANHGGYPETIMQSAPKLAFEPVNHRDLALTMLNALKMKPGLLRTKQVASEASRYTWDRTNAAITSIIDRVIKRKAFLMMLRSFFKK